MGRREMTKVCERCHEDFNPYFDLEDEEAFHRLCPACEISEWLEQENEEK